MRVLLLPMKATTTAFLLASSPGYIPDAIDPDFGHSGSGNTSSDDSKERIQPFVPKLNDDASNSVETKLSPPKGYGVFATQTIPKGTFVCRYMGELLTNDQQEERYPFDQEDTWPEYCLRISPELCIDGIDSGHWSRYVNHHEDPNLVVKIHGLDDETSPTNSRDETSAATPTEDKNCRPFAYFESIRTIAVGEELSFDYGPVYFHVRGIVPAPGTESRTVKTYQDKKEQKNLAKNNQDDDQRDEIQETDDRLWVTLGLPEIPRSLGDVRKILQATRSFGNDSEVSSEVQPKVSNKFSRAVFVRALDYFGAVEWIDNDTLLVTVTNQTNDNDESEEPRRTTTQKVRVEYPSATAETLARHLEDAIRRLSPEP